MSGRLAVVGIGPGAVEQLTAAAAAELAAAELLVGYGGYLDQLPTDVAPGRREAYPIGDEHERARRAVSAAADGARVALVSSGDPGIYGMASLAIDQAAALGESAPEQIGARFELNLPSGRRTGIDEQSSHISVFAYCFL